LGLDSFGVARADIGNGAGGYYALQNLRVVNDGQWHHLAAVVTSSQGVLYVDGVAGTAQAISGLGLNSARPIIFGNDPCCGGRFFSGIIDEVRIWNIALSQTQIKTTMNQTLSVPQPGLIAYWRLDETGNYAIDSSGNGNTGTLVNGPNRVPSV